MTAPVLEQPRSPYRRGVTRRSNFEMYGWVFMRLSGAVLVVLVLGHLFVNLVSGEGIQGISFGFVAGKWASPFWQLWDLVMLWLAMLHGANGVRTIINDYSERDGTRMVLKTLLAAALLGTLFLGTLVIYTFDPCPVINGSLASGVPAFCSTL